MSKREKLRLKLKNNPKGRTKQEIITLLGHYGFVLDHVTGSHHVFVLALWGQTHRIVVPIHGQNVKPVYVKLVLEKIEEIFPSTADEEAGNDE